MTQRYTPMAIGDAPENELRDRHELERAIADAMLTGLRADVVGRLASEIAERLWLLGYRVRV